MTFCIKTSSFWLVANFIVKTHESSYLSVFKRTVLLATIYNIYNLKYKRVFYICARQISESLCL